MDYREISVAGEGRGGRKAVQRRSPAPRRAPAVPTPDWRALGTGLIAYARAKPGTVLAAAVALGAVGMVCLNALGSQTGRHPAPILPKVAIRHDAQREAKAPERPAEEARAARGQEAAAAPANSAASLARPARDPIAALLRQEETTASVTPKVERAEKSKDGAPRTEAGVLQAQRALNKLGYGPLKADGLMGPGTRAAIEKFERDRKLPVKGEAAGRTLRELANRAQG